MTEYNGMENRLSILIFEHNMPDARLMVEALARAGYSLDYHVSQALPEFVEQLEKHEYDLVLSEHDLGKWKGTDALQALQQSGKDISFILVTARLGDESAVNYIKAGASDYVPKDRLERLPLAVEGVLRESARRQSAASQQRALAESERKKAEELYQSRQMLQSILDTIPQRVFWKDRNSSFLGCNKAFAIDAGLKDPAEIIGKNDHELAWTEMAEQYRADDKLVIDQAIPRLNFDETQSRPDGSLLWLRTSKLPLRGREGRVIGVIGTYEDITELKRAEEERARLILAVEQAVELIMITDIEGNIVYVNPAFARVTGYQRDEVMGKNPRFLNSGRQGRPFYEAMWAALLAGNVWSGHFVNKRKDGGLYEQEGTITPVRDLAGHVVNYLAVQRDVTHERLLEEQLRQAQKMEAIGRLAGGVAHDFNNMLMVISGYSELLMERTTSQKPLHEPASAIREAAGRAADLTRQLLAFSRQQALEPKVLNLNQVIANLEKMLRRLVSEDVELVTVLDPTLGQVQADPGQMEQVLMNLAVNARDAMPSGGNLVIETANVDLDETYCRDHAGMLPGRYVMLAVSDNGSGMDAQTQARIFEPFFTTKELGKGTGLGLATVYGIVRQSGGFVWVYSELRKGTTLKVYLPRVLIGADDSPSPMATELVGGTETILLVEDDPRVRELIRGTLQRQGYTVLEASNGADALHLSQQYNHPIHLLITDTVMPGASGPELAQRLAPVRQEMKVLYMSGYAGDIVTRHRFLESGAAFLQKPFTAEVLTRKLRELLG